MSWEGSDVDGSSVGGDVARFQGSGDDPGGEVGESGSVGVGVGSDQPWSDESGGEVLSVPGAIVEVPVVPSEVGIIRVGEGSKRSLGSDGDSQNDYGNDELKGN